jgi:quinol monooxygenase YgiN
MRVTAIYLVQAKPGKEGELLEMLQQGREFALGVDGCVGFDVFQGHEDPTKFVMNEHWESERHSSTSTRMWSTPGCWSARRP